MRLLLEAIESSDFDEIALSSASDHQLTEINTKKRNSTNNQEINNSKLKKSATQEGINKAIQLGKMLMLLIFPLF